MIGFGGDTVTDATGIGAGSLTVSAEPLLFPLAEALINELPCLTPLTFPVASTVATVGSELSHVIVCPASVLPLESWSVAVACAVPPTVTVEGLSETERLAIGVGGGGVTDIVA
jgi:hypothetical protein